MVAQKLAMIQAAALLALLVGASAMTQEDFDDLTFEAVGDETSLLQTSVVVHKGARRGKKKPAAESAAAEVPEAPAVPAGLVEGAGMDLDDLGDETSFVQTSVVVHRGGKKPTVDEMAAGGEFSGLAQIYSDLDDYVSF
eukprot:gnl/TRDRNA2_/TRDRNA2_179009_c0_seq1.p2 gnl/TRDRNA2_/TRDRNA2_179009_c0~~gnl/TRDRNA2_/TRDRNA2_179009_c0_seq1.p2  ORF type:complete len:162 (-),score=39.89 gnl/TRDRNA2_/TRDRNA2_179009_c0_seq1:152-568(-)